MSAGFRLRHRLRPADGLAANNARDDVGRIFLLVRDNLIAVPAQRYGALVSLELEAAHACFRKARRTFAELADRLEAGILDQRVLHVRHLAVVFEKQPASSAGHGHWSLDACYPVNNIKRMGAEI